MGTTLCSYYQVSVTCSSIFRVILLFFCFFLAPASMMKTLFVPNSKVIFNRGWESDIALVPFCVKPAV